MTARLAVRVVIFVLYRVLATAYGEHRRMPKCLRVIRPCRRGPCYGMLRRSWWAAAAVQIFERACRMRLLEPLLEKAWRLNMLALGWVAVTTLSAC